MQRSVHLTLTILLIIGLSVIYYLHFSASRLVYVDSAKLVNNYQGMIDARKVFQQKSLTWKSNIDTLSVEVQNAIKSYEKESISMSEKEKELSRELIRTKQKQLMEYQKAMNEKAGGEDAQMTGQVLEQVNAYIRKYGEDHGYKIILAATEYGNIAYAAEGLDITEEVLEGLNKQYAGQ